MSDERKDITQSTVELDQKIVELATQVMSEPDADKSKDQLALFNWHMSKKNISRILKLNDLYDDVTDQMVVRFRTKADQFTNSDLLDYMKAVQTAIDTSAKNLSDVQQPPAIVQNNNTQVNINVVDSFDKDSRARILAAVQATLKQATSQKEPEPIVVEATEVETPSETTEKKEEP